MIEIIGGVLILGTAIASFFGIKKARKADGLVPYHKQFKKMDPTERFEKVAYYYGVSLMYDTDLTEQLYHLHDIGKSLREDTKEILVNVFFHNNEGWKILCDRIRRNGNITLHRKVKIDINLNDYTKHEIANAEKSYWKGIADTVAHLIEEVEQRSTVHETAYKEIQQFVTVSEAAKKKLRHQLK